MQPWIVLLIKNKLTLNGFYCLEFFSLDNWRFCDIIRKRWGNMDFVRNKYFDNLIIKVKENKKAIKDLDLEELTQFVEYLTNLKKYLQDKEGK